MDWLLKRLSEPSTWGGLALAVSGVGQLGKINEAPAVVDALGQGAQAVAHGTDPVTAGVMVLGGLLAAFMREKGQ